MNVHQQWTWLIFDQSGQQNTLTDIKFGTKADHGHARPLYNNGRRGLDDTVLMCDIMKSIDHPS